MNQKGFINIIAVVVGVIIILAGAAGYFIVSRKISTPTVTSTPTSTPPKTQNIVAPPTPTTTTPITPIPTPLPRDKIMPSITIKTSSQLTGVVGSNFFAEFEASGGVPAYVWSVSSGSLPPGLKLVEPAYTGRACTPDSPPCPPYAPTAVFLQGVTAQAGDFTFELNAKDQLGKIGQATFTVSISSAGAGSGNSLIQVLAPNGGEQWPRGSTTTIRWSTDKSIERVSIFLEIALLFVRENAKTFMKSLRNFTKTF